MELSRSSMAPQAVDGNVPCTQRELLHLAKLERCFPNAWRELPAGQTLPGVNPLFFKKKSTLGTSALSPSGTIVRGRKQSRTTPSKQAPQRSRTINSARTTQSPAIKLSDECTQLTHSPTIVNVRIMFTFIYMSSFCPTSRPPLSPRIPASSSRFILL